jgi:hypothetical protein
MAVPVTRPRTPAGSTQYLLSIDRTLRKLSLRKIPVRVKQAAKRIQSRPTKKAVARKAKAPADAVPPMNGWPASRKITYALVGIVAAATMIGLPNLVQQSDSTIAATRSATSGSAMTPRSAQPSSATKAAVKPAAAAKRNTNPDLTSSKRPIETAQTPAVTPVQTISGCLQGGDDSFWLKDTDGADAPRARSWKSGFLMKHSASIQIVDGADALNLSKYVGQRVTATGTLANRTMHARSLHRVAASCN